jgi:hypothetical protein
MFNWLLFIDPALAFPIVIVVSVIPITVTVLVTRRLFPYEALKERHEVVSVVFSALTLIYAVLLAFGVIVTWQGYDTASRNVTMEANKIADLFADAKAFPEPTSSQIRRALLNYARTILADDWPAMGKLRASPQTVSDARRELWTEYFTIDPRTLSNPQWFSESVRQLNTMSDFKRLRWWSANQRMPEALWLVLLGLGLYSVVHLLFFGVRSLRWQLLMTNGLGASIACLLFLIFVLDHPFLGYSSVSSEPFQFIVAIFQRVT